MAKMTIRVEVRNENLEIGADNADMFMSQLKHYYSWMCACDFKVENAIPIFPILESFDIIARACGIRTPIVPEQYKEEIISLTKEYFPKEPNLEELYHTCEYRSPYETKDPK